METPVETVKPGLPLIDAMKVIKSKGIKVPEEMGVIGFANLPISDLVEPSLSTIEQPAQELGQKATELMLKQLDNREEFEPETVVVPTRLIVRNSTKRK